MSHGIISYNSEPRLQKKRVLLTPTVAADELKAGHVVCYDHDRSTDMSGTTVSAGTLNPARFLCVEKPKTANLRFVAGIVCPESEGAVNGDWINIYELNGADIQVWTDQDCTNGTTTLAVTDDSYIVTAAGAANVALGLAKDTIARAGTNGFCLMKSYPSAGLIGDITAVSAALSTLQESAVSDLTSAVSDLDSRCDSLTLAVASIESTHRSVIASQAKIASDATSAVKDSGHSELLSQAKILSDLVETVDSNQNDSITSLIAADDSVISRCSTYTSAAKESCFSHISSLEDWCSDTMSNMTASINTQIDSAISDVSAGYATRCDSIETRMLSVTSDMTASINTMVDSMHSDMTASINTQIDSAISDIRTAVDSVETRMLSVTSNMTASINTQIDSAISDISAGYATRFNLGDVPPANRVATVRGLICIVTDYCTTVAGTPTGYITYLVSPGSMGLFFQKNMEVSEDKETLVDGGYKFFTPRINFVMCLHGMDYTEATVPQLYTQAALINTANYTMVFANAKNIGAVRLNHL